MSLRLLPAPPHQFLGQEVETDQFHPGIAIGRIKNEGSLVFGEAAPRRLDGVFDPFALNLHDSLLCQGPAEPAMGFRRGSIDRDGATRMLDGTIHLPVTEQELRQRQVRRSVAGVRLDEAFQRLLGFPDVSRNEMLPCLLECRRWRGVGWQG